MLKKLDIKDYENKQQLVWFGIINKLNELCDIINAIIIDVDGTKCVDGSKAPADNSEKANCQENVQQVSYIAPGDMTLFHGAGCSVEFDTPLPKGTRITIKSITKGGNNE